MTGAAAVLVSAALALSGCTGSDAVSSNPNGNNNGFKFNGRTAVGQVEPEKARKKAEDFTVDGLDGGKIKLSSMRGKVVVLNFWASWCGPCQTETPEFDSVYRKIHKRGVDFVGIDFKDDRGNAKSFVQTNHISYPIAYDEEGATALRLGNLPTGGLPFTVLIDRTGKVASVWVDRLTPVDLTHGVDKLLAER
jgi:peroxiredoxin